MRIYRGNIVSKRFVPTLLEAVPEEDLEELKSIRVRMRPAANESKTLSGRYSPSKQHLNMYAQTHLFAAKDRFSVINDDFYGLFTRSFAKTLYHEVGHHWDQLRNADCAWFGHEYNSTLCNEAYHMIELVAKNYAKKIIPVAEEMRLYDKLNPGDMPYAYALFRKYVHRCIRRFEAGKYADGGWSELNPILNYLRKQKLGPEARYNVPQLFNKTFEEYKYYMLEKNCKRRFRRFAVKQVEPLLYVSKGNRHYPFFTEDHLEVITSLKDRFNLELYGKWAHKIASDRDARAQYEASREETWS